MLSNYHLVERLAREHHRELLCQAEEERRARALESRNGKGEPEVDPLLEVMESQKPRETAEQLGHQLGRVIYCCYSELLDRGLPQEEAVKLTMSLINSFTPSKERAQGCSPVESITMLCYH